MNASALLQYIDDHQERLFELLQSMIAIPTENDGIQGNETPLAAYMQQLFSRLGISGKLYCPSQMPETVSHPDYNHNRSMEGRCNITAYLPGTGWFYR